MDNDLKWGFLENGVRVYDEDEEESSEEAESSGSVSGVSDNHVYFYSDVTKSKCLSLAKAVHRIDSKLRRERLSRGVPDDFPMLPIWIHINSNGGSLLDAFSVVDQLMAVKSPIHTVVEGLAASAATIISVAGDQRFILPSGYMMIHQLSGWARGTYREIRDTVGFLDMAMETLISLYEERTNMEREEIKQLLSKDSWFGAEGALEKGLVDVIVGK